MNCYIFLAIFAIAAYTAAMCYEPEQHGYSQSDVTALNRLIDRETKPVRHKAWTGEETRSALKELGWEVAGK